MNLSIHRAVLALPKGRLRPHSFALSSQTSCFPQRPRTNGLFKHAPFSRSFGRFYSSGANSELSRLNARKGVIWTIIGCNAAVFAAWQYGTSPSIPIKDRVPVINFLTQNFMMSSDHIRAGRWWTTLTAAFSQKDTGHFIFNMIALHQLGQVLVYTPGLSPVALTTLCIGSALAGSAAYVLHQQAEPGRRGYGLGASGMVMGVTAAAVCLTPFAKVAIWGIIPMPLWGFGVFNAVYDAYFVGQSTGVAHDAHLGGLVFGLAFYMLRLRRFGGIMGTGSYRGPY